MNSKYDLIKIEQLPIISQKLDLVSKEILQKTTNACKLICNEDSVKEIKQLRASLTKEFNELEAQRKQIKNAIMEKYDAFEVIYKEKISNLYKQADIDLKNKIDNVENQLKLEKENELRDFAKSHFEFNHIEEIVKFEDIGLNITLSASMKSLKDQIETFCKKISDDLMCITSDNDRDELLYEYQHNGFDYAKAVIAIRTKKEELEKIKAKEEERLKIKEQEQQVVEQVKEKLQEIVPPKEIIEIPEEIIEVQFTVKGTINELRELKQFMNEKGIKYE